VREKGFVDVRGAFVVQDAAGAMDAENAPTALSSDDDFKNGQKTGDVTSIV